jgi:von Willebrand factor type A domain/Vault protein inter-alpha-trypsin domain
MVDTAAIIDADQTIEGARDDKKTPESLEDPTGVKNENEANDPMVSSDVDGDVSKDHGPDRKQEAVSNGAVAGVAEVPVVKVEKEPVMQQATRSATSPATPAMNHAPRQGGCSWISLLILFIIVVVIVIVIVMITQKQEPEEYVPATVNFEAGVSLVTNYIVNTTVASRLCRTKISMDIVNALDCSSIHSVTLQLPVDTFVVSLQTISDNGCTTHGQVGKLKDVRETFLEMAAEGLPGAYVEEQDSSMYSLQVSIPPFGETRVELVFEALLQQRLGEVEFKLPLIPNEKVDRLVLDLTVEDVASQLLPTSFFLDFNGYYQNLTVTANSSYSLDLPDAREHTLPRVLKGKYQPATIPENGMFYADGTCFEHYFRPSTLAPMKRNLVFLVDNSDSDQLRLNAIKEALQDFIDTLTPDDTLTIQTFGEKGTEELWGSASASVEEKADAKKFVQGLAPKEYYSYANLHEAVLEGLLRARTKDSGDDTVTILMLISDGEAESGEQRRPKIVEDTYKLNRDGKVKVFALSWSSPGSSGMDLLNAISTMNGGVAASLNEYEPEAEPLSEQIKSFFDIQFGNVVLFDVAFQPNFKVHGVSNETFAILSQGYEIVLRGLLHPNDAQQVDSLRILTAGSTADGIIKWNATASQYTLSLPTEGKNSRCFQSYAHSRIAQLMRYQGLVGLVPDEILLDVIQSAENCTKSDTALADCIEQEALSLALEGNIVAKGLTGMTTVDDESCLPKNDIDVGICRDGTGTDEYHWEDASVGRSHGSSDDYNSGAAPSCSKFTIVLCFCLMLTKLLF